MGRRLSFLDHEGKRLQNAVSYRDSRTDTTMGKLFNEVSKYDVFQKTGIQFLTFNTIYQLFEETHALKDQAHDILLIPDYLNYLLTNKKRNEITNLSTTQLLSVHDHSLDQELLTSIGIDKEQFPNTIEPGTYIGEINADLNIQNDLPVTHVYATASHDTASAVLGSVGDACKKWAFYQVGLGH
ncbi:FGGY family carbohydrate kinase [Staphylococcus equorum]|uniref:FGGY family carbohydrate kinase n=1 Tax=Staphylococcus equorum TaxID=246432 RepID=UPI002982493C|nr:FGGY family carbohydrate kinase [Staphylococcus equorum]MDW5470400.1 FGGY family carbohydrate kinase [Staphylococcus equorum]